MRNLIGTNALQRLRDYELIGLQKLLFRALNCPETRGSELPAIRATLAVIEAELARRSCHLVPCF
ncbi:hypothetical protein [Roseibium sp.]|uniref:hypothetical protein n=1 Tax=Roseibium sp. TaxID=1936156 RepID=UPI003B5208CB